MSTERFFSVSLLTALLTVGMALMNCGPGMDTVAVSRPPEVRFSPSSGPVGTLVTLTGLDSSQTYTSVSIGGVSAVPVSQAAGSVVAMVMPGAISGSVVISGGGTTTAASDIFTVTAAKIPVAQQGAKATGPSGAWLGFTVALSADGNTAMSGAPFSGGGVGGATIYTRSAGVWTAQGNPLIGNDAVGTAAQGVSVALSADGNTAVLGGTIDNSNQGAAWVFTRSGTTWSQQGPKLFGTGNAGSANQGSAVALSADGDTALVGGKNDAGGLGAAWVFTRSGGVWTQQGSKLTGTGGAPVAAQGYAVALSADGNTALVGGNSNSQVGAVWVFTRTAGVWTQQGSKLVGSGNIGNATQGNSVALSADGNVALLGGPNDNSGQGATWVFARTGQAWAQVGAKLVANDAAGPPQQGVAVALNAEGTVAVIGGNSDDLSTGAFWIFASSNGIWSQQGSKHLCPLAVGNANAGGAVAISADTSSALIGGPADNSLSGAVWFFAP